MLRILVVEDNPDLRETLSLLLEGDDRHIESAANAEDGLRMYDAQPFDVVFSTSSSPACPASSWPNGCARRRLRHGS
jgi:two-component system, cell cycle response regulator CpdR